MLDPMTAGPSTGLSSATLRHPAVRRIVLTDFRSYATLDLAIGAPIIVLTGENGAGKTNLLEAISLFSAGRGLRRADPADLGREGGPGRWAASIGMGESDGEAQLGTGWEPGGAGLPGRRCRIDRVPVASASAFADWVRVVWLTPAMDGLFAGPAAERRRFLDRLVLAVDPQHGARVNAMERALRNRNRLLENGSDRAWLDAAEREVVDLSVAVAAARHECVGRLVAVIERERDDTSPFAWASLALEGEIETLVAQHPALEVERRYRALLRDNRGRDAAAGRTLVGPHLGDLAVRHGPKNIAAARASTGEQKALLVGLVLAHAQLTTAMSGMTPIILLDEVAAHFDPTRRAALFEKAARLCGQVWMTGADAAAFADIDADVQRWRVTPGRLELG